MFCENCGNEIKVTSKFCTKCGKKNRLLELENEIKFEEKSEEKFEEKFEEKNQSLDIEVDSVISKDENSEEQADITGNENTEEQTDIIDYENYKENLSEHENVAKQENLNDTIVYNPTEIEISKIPLNNIDNHELREIVEEMQIEQENIENQAVSDDAFANETDAETMKTEEADEEEIEEIDEADYDTYELEQVTEDSNLDIIEKYDNGSNKFDKKKIIIISSVSVLVLLIAAFSIFKISLSNKVEPTFNDEIQELTVDTYVKDINNYSLSAENEILLNLDEDKLNSLIYMSIRENNKDEGITVNSVKYSGENEELRVNIDSKSTNMEIVYSSEIKAEQNGIDVILKLDSEFMGFGKDAEDVPFYEDRIPDGFCDVDMVLPGVCETTSVEGIIFEGDNANLVLNLDTNLLTGKVPELSNYIDISYEDLIEEHPEDPVANFLATAPGSEEMKTSLYFFTEEGYKYIIAQAPIMSLYINESLVTTIKADKEKLYEAQLAEIEDFANSLLTNLNKYYSLDDVLKTNGHLYYYRDYNSVISASNLIGDIAIPSKVSINSFDVVYNLSTKEPGISYQIGPDKYNILYNDATTESYTAEEYDNIYKNQVMPKGEIETPMPGDTERQPIVDGIRDYTNISGTYFVRYMRNDEKFAYAIVSPTDDYQSIYGYVLKKSSNGNWEVIDEVTSNKECEEVIQRDECVDINLELFPEYFPDSFEVYWFSEEDIQNIAYYFYYDMPKDENGYLYPVEFFTTIDDEYMYFKFDSPGGESYFVSEDFWLEEIETYDEMLDIAEHYYGYFPVYIGLQIN